MIQRRGHDNQSPKEYFSEIDNSKGLNTINCEESSEFFNLSVPRNEISFATFKDYILGDATEYSEYTDKSSIMNIRICEKDQFKSDLSARENPQDLGSILIHTDENKRYEEKKQK